VPIENFFTDGLMDRLDKVILAHFGRKEGEVFNKF
jgi:hypothetical protein